MASARALTYHAPLWVPHHVQVPSANNVIVGGGHLIALPFSTNRYTYLIKKYISHQSYTIWLIIIELG